MLAIVVKLTAVTLVMVGGLLFAARYSRGGGRSGSGVRVTGRHGISKGAVVAVVEVDGRRFLVGAGDQQVTLLGELDPAAEAEEAEAPADGVAASPADRPLAQRLGAALVQAHRQSRRPHRTGPSTTSGPRIGPLDRLRAMTVRTHVGDGGALPGAETPIHVQHPTS